MGNMSNSSLRTLRGESWLIAAIAFWLLGLAFLAASPDELAIADTPGCPPSCTTCCMDQCMSP